MAEREVVLDEPVMEEQSEALQNAVERAERAEAELAKLKKQAGSAAATATNPSGKAPGPPAERQGRHLAEPGSTVGSTDPTKQPAAPAPAGHAVGNPAERGVAALREDSMMAHLLDALDAGTDIGHYGRLTFAMIARHFMTDDEVIAELIKDPDFSREQAVLMLKQVEGRDYNPPRRDRILEWQAEQEFAIVPNPEDPDCGNVYKSLRFPKELYDHIGHYQEQKTEAA